MFLWTRRSLRYYIRYFRGFFILLCCAVAVLTFVVVTILFARTVLIQHRLDVKLGARLEERRDLVDEARSLQRAERLAGALKIPTVSYKTDHQETQAFTKIHEYLQIS